MSTRDLIDAIEIGDSVAIQQTFESEMMSRIAERVDAKRIDVARNMFKTESTAVEEFDEELEDLEEAAGTVGDNHLHVQPVKKDGKIMYHVRGVGKNFADGIKPGEHLSDSELDDASEMGAKIKHVK